MRRFVTFVASTQGHLGWGRSWVHLVMTVLILHFTNPVKGWMDGGIEVPDVSCQTQMDCSEKGWTEPLPACHESRCRCPLGTCAVFTNTVTDYNYFCGSCGMLGSECTNTTDCKMDWQCEKHFCTCSQGMVYRGVCMYYGSVDFGISSIILTIIFVSVVIVIVIVRVVSNRWKSPVKFCSCTSENEESRVVARNPQSDDKTAAFTITNSDFMATAEDPDLAWALEHSRHLYYELDTSTVPTTTASFPCADQRFPDHRSPSQPGTSGWRQSPNSAGPQRRPCSTSISSTSSSQYCSSSSSSGSVSSYRCSLPSASLHSSFTSTFCPSYPQVPSDEVSLPALESLRTDFEDSVMENTRL